MKMPRRKFNPWKVRPESVAVGVVGRAKAAIGILADDLKSVRELWLENNYTMVYTQLVHLSLI